MANAATRHGIRFVPDDIRSEIPPVILECECQPPGNPHEVLGLHAVRLQYTPRLGKDRTGAVQKLRQSRFQPDLRIEIVVPETPVGWRRNDALHRVVGKAS